MEKDVEALKASILALSGKYRECYLSADYKGLEEVLDSVSVVI